MTVESGVENNVDGSCSSGNESQEMRQESSESENEQSMRYESEVIGLCEGSEEMSVDDAGHISYLPTIPISRDYPVFSLLFPRSRFNLQRILDLSLQYVWCSFTGVCNSQ